MPSSLFANNASATLAADISAGATTIAVSSGQGARFPNPTGGDWFMATLVDGSNNIEIVKCTARSSDSLTVTRAQESTSARAYTAGDKIELRITAGALNNKLDADATQFGGNAATATALDTARNITLSGDVTGTASFDGTGDANITTALASGILVPADFANFAANTLLGNNTGAPATPITMTVAQVKAMLGITNLTDAASTITGVITRSTQGAHIWHGSASHASGKITISTLDPSGGADGDIWIKVSA